MVGNSYVFIVTELATAGDLLAMLLSEGEVCTARGGVFCSRGVDGRAGVGVGALASTLLEVVMVTTVPVAWPGLPKGSVAGTGGARGG